MQVVFDSIDESCVSYTDQCNLIQKLIDMRAITQYLKMMTFDAPQENTSGRHMGKEENAGNQYFLLSLPC